MYILDTNHISVLERGGDGSRQLRHRMQSVSLEQVTVSVISYEEQLRGWLAYIGKTSNPERQAIAYKRLKQQLLHYCTFRVLVFDEEAAREYQRLRETYRRIGRMDLKIAAIALANCATLLTSELR